MVEEVVGGMDEGEGVDEGAPEAFAFEASPGPGGVNLLEVASAMQLVCEFKVMIDTKDCQSDLHRSVVPHVACSV